MSEGETPTKPTLSEFADSTNREAKLIDIEQTTNKLIGYVDGLNKRQADELIAALKKNGYFKEEIIVNYGADFSIADEMADQIKMVKALREKIMVGDDIVAGTSIQEAQRVVQSCGSMISMLVKNHKHVMSMERYRAIESTVIEVLKEAETKYPAAEGLLDYYLGRLAEKLELIDV